LTTAETTQEKLEIGLSRLVLGQVQAARGRLVEAGQELETGLSILDSIGSAVEAANARVALARVWRKQDRSEEARQLMQIAVAAYDAIGADALKQQALSR